MKIGIFGDSYGYKDARFSANSWIDHLSQMHDVTSHCENGASTYLIFQNFLKYHQLYDTVIVLVTFPTRIHTSIVPLPSNGIAKFWMNFHRNTLSYEKKRVLQTAGNFLDIIPLDDELVNQFVLFHNLLLDKIKTLRTDILFIPCFSFKETDFNTTCLYDISQKEEKAWGEKWERVLQKNARPYDERQCHMCDENNLILANQINDIIPLIKGHVTFNIDLDKFVDPDDISKYVPKKYYE